MELKKKKATEKHTCNLHVGIFVIQPLDFSSPSFLSILGRKIFGGLGKKTPSFSHIYLPTKHPPKSFSSSFSLFFFILPKIHTTKHILREILEKVDIFVTVIFSIRFRITYLIFFTENTVNKK